MSAIERYGLRTDDWFYYGQWEQPLLSAQFWVHWFDKELCDEMGVNIQQGKIMMVNGHTLPSRSEIEAAKKRLQEACVQQDGAFFTRVRSVSHHILEEHHRFAQELGHGGDCRALFAQFIASSRKAMMPWTLSVYFSDLLGDILAKRAEELDVGASRIIDYVPQQQTIMIKQHHEALVLKKELEEKKLLGAAHQPFDIAIAQLRRDEALWGKIQRHVNEYEWIGTHHFWGEPLTMEKFLREITALKEKASTHHVPTVALPRELAFLAQVAGEMMFLRQYAAEIFDIVAYKARQMLTEVAQQSGLSYDGLLLLTPDEILHHLNAGTQPSAQSLVRRRAGCCIFLQDGKEIIVDDTREVDEFLTTFAPPVQVGANEVRGTIASKGRAKGHVKVFLVPENLQKMNAGDVLVTTMTTPDFVPLMHKAAAIVTDVGGLLSHAAIVSREMGKPCIVGTRVATKVFKDGDLVEVDAEKGIVRKLS